MLLVMLAIQGCGTIAAVGDLVSDVGSDTAAASRAIQKGMTEEAR